MSILRPLKCSSKHQERWFESSGHLATTTQSHTRLRSSNLRQVKQDQNIFEALEHRQPCPPSERRSNDLHVCHEFTSSGFLLRDESLQTPCVSASSCAKPAVEVVENLTHLETFPKVLCHICSALFHLSLVVIVLSPFLRVKGKTNPCATIRSTRCPKALQVTLV